MRFSPESAGSGRKAPIDGAKEVMDMTELEKRAFAIRQQALSMWPWFVPEKWQDVPPYAKAHWLERALEENLQKRDNEPHS